MTFNLLTIIPTFLASLQAVGTASTMAFAGFYMHRRGFVTPSGKKMMALLSQQVTIPAFLFAKIIYCPPSTGGSTSSGGAGGIFDDDYGGFEEHLHRSLFTSTTTIFPLDEALSQATEGGGLLDTANNGPAPEFCPSITSKLGDVWMLVLWPFFVVACGLFVGNLAAKISRCPPQQRRSCLAACAFGNSTSLPLTLLEVIHGKYGPNTEFGRVDATAYLSVYLLLYPVLQWGIGGWLLAPEEKEAKTLYQSQVDLAKLAQDESEEVALVPADHNGTYGGVEVGGINGTFPSAGDTQMENHVESSDVTTNHPNGPASAAVAAGIFVENKSLASARVTPGNTAPTNHRAPPTPSYHVNHLLNWEVAKFSSNASYAAFIAGQEEFGGVTNSTIRHSNVRRRGSRNQLSSTGTMRSQLSSTGTMRANQSSGSVGYNTLMQELSFENQGASNDYESSGPSSSSMVGGLGDTTAMTSTNYAIGTNGENVIGEGGGGGENFLTDSESDEGPLNIEGEDANVVGGTGIYGKMSGPPTAIQENAPLLVEAVKPLSENGAVSLMGSFTQMLAIQESDVLPFTETLYRIACKVFQPPVLGALLGLFIAGIPSLRGIFQDIWDAGNDAPLQWLFRGVYSVGQAAIPINMTILGINFSSTFQTKKSAPNDSSGPKLLPNETMIALVVGKMIVMPVIGIFSTWLLYTYSFSLPEGFDSTVYLVMMIVFITPTANNVMVMVELSGSGSKEGMARLIGWQYMTAPALLSISLSIVVTLASCTFTESKDMC